MKVIFAGTPDFAAVALKAIAAAGFEIPLVLTQPDRPKGRGMQLAPSPVKQAALELGLRVAQPEKLRNNAEALQMLKEVEADVMVVAAYGLILPQDVLDTPKHGCLNIHASLLPRWRGAAPIQRAIEAVMPRRACASCRWTSVWTPAMWSANTVTPFNRPIRRMKYTMR